MKKKLIKDDKLFWTGIIFLIAIAPTAGNNRFLYFIGAVLVVASFFF